MVIQNDYRYLWKVLIDANLNDIDLKRIKFYAPKINISAYFELNDEDLNFSEIKKKIIDIGINTFYRFDDIFSTLPAEEFDTKEIHKEKLINIVLHYLGRIDLIDGLNYREILARKIIEEIEENFYGAELKECFIKFKMHEKQAVAMEMQDFYNHDRSFNSFKKITAEIFNGAIIYNHLYTSGVLAVFLNTKKSEKEKKKFKYLKEIFLPIDKKVKIFFDVHFSVVGVEETSKVGYTVVY